MKKPIIFFILIFALFFIAGTRNRVLASHICGTCPAGFEHGICLENHGCTCACGGQCPNGPWTSSCPGSYCCGGGPPDPGNCEPYCPPPPTAVPTPPPPTSTPTPTPTPTPARVSVSGTVYDDPSGLAGGLNKCIGPYGSPIKPGGGNVKVLVNPDDREGPVQGNGSYVVNQVLETGSKTITMQDYDPQYQCTCPTGCQYLSASVADA